MKSAVEEKRQAEEFYRDILQVIDQSNFTFLIGGAFALYKNTGIYRDTKDLDIFCKAWDYPPILNLLIEQGFTTEITDPRWIAKATKDNYLIDFIFNSPNSLCPVGDSWFDHAIDGELYGVPVKFLGPEDLFWCKIYVQNRERYDGADVNHIILKRGKDMDWKWLLDRMGQHWHLILAQFMNFKFIYPSEKDSIPMWLFEELLDRARQEDNLPAPIERICRGPLVDHTAYNTDILDWGYKIATCKKL